MSVEPVALSQDLAAQRVIRAQVGGQDLAIWRGASLSVQAWGNRCPHRGMRLSHGFVRGDSLACAYHGWHYNCQAVCHYMPAHPELEPPSTIRPVVFSAVEQQGVLWVSVDTEAKPVSLPEGLTGVRSITLECSFDHAVTTFNEIPLNDFSPAELVARELSADPKILAFNDNDNNASVLVLFNRTETNVVIAHVLASNDWSVDDKIELSRWCETVRRLAEDSFQVGE